MRRVEIHYRRFPDRLDVFEQQVVVELPDVIVTLHESPPPGAELAVDGRTVFEPGSPIVWFVFPGTWYDMGRFHLRDGTFTGYYVNLITPPELSGGVWHMVDLCLDLWISPSGAYRVLDQDDFDEAVDRGWIDSTTAERARLELDGLIAAVRSGAWPPAVAREYDLARVRELHAASGAGSSDASAQSDDG